MKPTFTLLTFSALLLSPLAALQAADSLSLAAEGKVLVPVVISENASTKTLAAANELAGYLSKISGAKFEVEKGDGSRGIVLGTADEFPEITQEPKLKSKSNTDRENYLLRSEKKRLVLIGNTPQAVEHAVWDVLHRLGYRQFFPGKTWEVVPRIASLSIAVEAVESPDYHARRIWFGFGPLKEREAAYDEWCRRNRAVSGITLRAAHAYDGILSRNKALVAEHPEYLALVGGERKPSKFCISNPELRRLVVYDSLAQFATNPTLDSISCEPSDGGGWCECAECARLGSISDRALLLANEVAAAVSAQHLGRIVGMYAYNEHSPPPSIAAHPQVVISVATGFILGGYSIDQLISGWQAKTKTLGIREYYSVTTWDRDAPGAARGGNIEYLRTTIPHFYQSGARFMSAESSDNFGPNGLGYYLATRMLWHVDEGNNLEALTADFLDNAFGSARAPMAKFYTLLDGTKRQALSDDLLSRMYRLLDEARGLTRDESILARLSDLTLYTRYVELYLDYSSANGAARQTAFEQLMRHTWRIRGTGMVHSKALYRDLPFRDKSVTLPVLGKFSDPDQTNPWKSSEPFTSEQIASFIRDGIANRKLLDFVPVAFSGELVPATPLKLPPVPLGNAGIYLRGVRDFWTWTDHAPSTFSLTGKVGIVYTSRGTAKIELYPLAEAELKSVAHSEIESNKAEHELALQTQFTGLHRIEVSDHRQGTIITWKAGMPMTLLSSQEHPAKLYGRWHLYFYVPKGTKVIGGFSDGQGLLLNPTQKVVHQFAAKPGYFSVAVPAGEDGKLWSFKNTIGDRILMTVPPCLARDASELLLPAEIVKLDSRP